MKRIIGVCLLSFTLAACATLPDGTKVFLPTASVNNPVSPSTLYDIKATYAVEASGAAEYIERYRQGHRCTKTSLESVSNICSRRSIVLKLQKADRDAQLSLGKATTFIRDNPTLDASSLISAAQIAVTAFYTIQQGNP